VAELVTQFDALAGDVVATLREAILASPLVGRSTLAGSFRVSRGFAMTFTTAGIAQVRTRFPELVPFLEQALLAKSAARLRSLKDRVLGREAPPNAWYLNVLVLNGGAAIGRHLDGTLRGPTGDKSAIPRWVSVLYLLGPAAGGGELLLWRGARQVARVTPCPGLLLHFRGDLEHEVTALEQAAEAAPRLSIVLEQYALSSPALEKLPAFALQSGAGFSAFLEDRARRPRDESALHEALESPPL
jgi:hypothetical protein